MRTGGLEYESRRGPRLALARTSTRAGAEGQPRGVGKGQGQARRESEERGTSELALQATKKRHILGHFVKRDGCFFIERGIKPLKKCYIFSNFIE